jgi:two-component system sensor histidine kinase TtrS
MQRNGSISLGDFKIINQQHHEDFAEIHSTRLYPEWPFSKLGHTPDDLAQAVAIALMEMHYYAGQQEDMSRHDRWSIPLEYQPVHELLKTLHLPPYDQSGEFTLADAIDKYWYGVMSGLVFIFSLGAMSLLVLHLNRELRISKNQLEQQHTLILNSVADGIYGVDLDGNSTFINKAMEELTGWKAEEIIGKNQHALLHHTRSDGNPFPESECPVYRTYADNRTRVVEDDIFWRKDGTSFPVAYTATPLKNKHDQTIGSVVVFRDISHQKTLEANKRRHQQELAHVSRVSTMGEMASGIAHELNQPLTAISTNALACIRLVDSEKLNPEQVKDILERINKQALRAGGIIKQLRGFIRKDTPKKSRVNLNNIVKEVVILIEHSFDPNQIRLNLQLADALPDIIAQHILIDQVLVNLIKNAIDAMDGVEENSKVLTISTALAPDDMIIVGVNDTGKGMDENIVDTIFSPYVSGKEKGMGLGLSISQKIIEDHGGELFLHQTSAHGTEFRFTLPSAA